MIKVQDTKRKMILGVQNLLYGASPGAWRTEESPSDLFMNIDEMIRVTKLAEKGKFHFSFIADHAAMRVDPTRRSPHATLDPIVIVSGLLAHTERIGFVLTQSTTFNHPYTVARQMKAMDVLSKGRIGWNAVTTSDHSISANFGSGIADRKTRYEMANEFIEMVQALWGSWGQDALKIDKQTGIFADIDHIQPVNLKGKYNASRGPLPIPPSPQGQPVIFQAGGGQEGLDMAGRFASGIYSIVTDEQTGVLHRKALDEAARAAGRNPEDIKLFMGINVTVEDSYDLVMQRRRKLFDLSQFDPEAELYRLSALIGVRIPLSSMNTPLPEQVLDYIEPSPYGLHSDAACRLLRNGLTPYEVLLHGVLDFHTTVLGTPQDIADEMQRLFEAGACDGFIIMDDNVQDGLPAFIEKVNPILQERGLFHTDYEGRTLREHFGIPYQYGPE